MMTAGSGERPRRLTAGVFSELEDARSRLHFDFGEMLFESWGLTAVFRALGGGWQIRVDGNFVTAATVDQMRARTDWVACFGSAR